MNQSLPVAAASIVIAIAGLGLSACTEPPPPPPPPAAPTGPTSIETGVEHTCAITSAGGVRCWGGNDFGQLGNGTTADSSTPVDVVGLSAGVTAISAGMYHTCAISSGGGVTCWGENSWGQLGNGTSTDSSTPVDVVGLTSGVTAISSNGQSGCAVTSSGGARCWGYNVHGGLGDGTTTPRSAPVDVVGLTAGVVEVAAGLDHSCAVTTGGGVKCWGWNVDGRLGNGTTTDSPTPVDVTGASSGIESVEAGHFHTCALTVSGAVVCWGSNGNGQLGTGTIEPPFRSPVPVPAIGLASGVTDLKVGGHDTCAVVTSGAMCWGYNAGGQLGSGSLTPAADPVPKAVAGLTAGTSAVAPGFTHTCARSSAGGINCWGVNDMGQLGDGTTTNSLTPTDVLGYP